MNPSHFETVPSSSTAAFPKTVESLSKGKKKNNKIRY